MLSPNKIQLEILLFTKQAFYDKGAQNTFKAFRKLNKIFIHIEE